MKYLYLLILITFFNEINAKNVSCNFEEVYQDGSIQYGHMLFKNGLLRYEYNDKQLFTIIFNNDYFIIRNDDKNNVSKLDNNIILNELKTVIDNYPKIKSSYNNDEIKIRLFESKDYNFLKRISINSPDANLSIYFLNCNFEDISKRYFQPFLLPEIKK